MRFTHRTGRYTLDALGPGGVTGLTTLTVDGDGELEVRNANGYAGTTDLQRGPLGDDAALGHSTLLVGGGAVRALGDRRLANPVRFRHPDGQGPVTATITSGDDLTVAGDVELNPAHPTSVAVDGAGVARLLGAVRDPADGPGTLVKLGYRGGDGNDVVLEPLRAPDPAPRPVTLAAVADQAVDEGEQLARRLHADPGEPAKPLRWRLLGRRPAGLRLDRGGALRWTPRETQGPGRYQVVVRVEDAGDPGRHDQRSFTVTVGEVNLSPMLRGPARASVAERAALRLAFAASDPDHPGARLEYGPTGDAPGGARIDPRTGVLRWTPGGGQGPGEYTVVVWVLDDGTQAGRHQDRHDHRHPVAHGRRRRGGDAARSAPPAPRRRAAATPVTAEATPKRRNRWTAPSIQRILLSCP